MTAHKALFSFDIAITARCNNNCRHCYINLPATDSRAKGKEPDLEKIKRIVDEAVSLGALWCLVSGGEPLLRDDFCDIYRYLKQKGLLISVFTNATLVTEQHVRLFKKYPPRNIEVSVYGSTQETYERVTRTPGSFAAFENGLKLLLKSGLAVRLKAMALRSNVHEMPQIASFCRKKSCDDFRFDPFLHLRLDGDLQKNITIAAERLSVPEIILLERSDPKRLWALKKECGRPASTGFLDTAPNQLFHCGAGIGNFSLSHNGLFSLCSALLHPDCVYNLDKGSLKDAFDHFVPSVRGRPVPQGSFMEKCNQCSIINLCMGCPAHVYLETGQLDTPVSYFCELAHARAAALGLPQSPNSSRQEAHRKICNN